MQERLFDRMDDLLELDVAVPDMADLLAEVRYCVCVFYIAIYKAVIVKLKLWQKILNFGEFE